MVLVGSRHLTDDIRPQIQSSSGDGCAIQREPGSRPGLVWSPIHARKLDGLRGFGAWS
jgi:hypothetical protein